MACRGCTLCNVVELAVVVGAERGRAACASASRRGDARGLARAPPAVAPSRVARGISRHSTALPPPGTWLPKHLRRHSLLSAPLATCGAWW